MNMQEAQQAFESGLIQPQCPGCGQSILIRGKRVKMTKKGTYDFVLATAYACAQCGEKFVAWIGEADDGEG